MRIVERARMVWWALAGLGALTLLTAGVTLLRRPVWGISLLAALVVSAPVLRLLSRRVRAGTTLDIDLERGVVEQVPSDPLGRALAMGALALRDVVDALDRAAGDDRVASVVARLGTGRIGLAQAQELRDAVTRFREKGKRAVAYAETFGEGRSAMVPYYLATAFDEIHLQPIGEVHATGVMARRPFLRPLLDLADVTPEFDHRREYKAAMYLFTEEGFTAPDREATTALLDSQLTQMVDGIAAGRGLEPRRVRELVDQGPLLAHEALEAGLIDRTSYRDEIFEGVDRRRLLTPDRYLRRAGRPHRRGAGVALVYGVGGVTRGHSRFDPLTRGPALAADTVAAALRAAARDRRVKAVVFRVDSPGGSAVASDVVGRAVTEVQAAGKPVVVSMGDTAASGGYWVAAGADRIVAQPGTITGSIGVVTGKLVTRRAWRRLGVAWEELHLGRNAAMLSPDREWSAGERDRVTAELDFIYDRFKQRVGEGRRLEPEAVEELARGRVWSGETAMRLGLVDAHGGLEVAVALAGELAGIPPEGRVRVVPFPRESRLPTLRTRREEETAAFLGPLVEAVRSLAETTSTRGTARLDLW